MDFLDISAIGLRPSPPPSSVLLHFCSDRRIVAASANSGLNATSAPAPERIIPGSILDRINSQEADWQKLSDEELKQTATKLRARLAAGETLDDMLPEAFAAVREAGRRFLEDAALRRANDRRLLPAQGHDRRNGHRRRQDARRHAAGLPQRPGRAVHVVTVNDYLARRDMEWMGPLYLGLGLTVGAIQANMDSDERKAPTPATSPTARTTNSASIISATT